jgi:hypothetical protein
MSDVGFWQGIADTVHGRGQLRLIIQPLIGIIVGARLGVKDAKAGAEPFVKRLVLGKDRAKLAKEALVKVLIPFGMAVVLDSILQYVTLHRVRPSAAVIMGTVLVLIPFMVSRAFSNRIWHLWCNRHQEVVTKDVQR